MTLRNNPVKPLTREDCFSGFNAIHLVGRDTESSECTLLFPLIREEKTDDRWSDRYNYPALSRGWPLQAVYMFVCLYFHLCLQCFLCMSLSVSVIVCLSVCLSV